MKKIFFFLSFIFKIIFFISIYNTIHAKNLDKYYDEDNISNYFSGIISLKDNDYANSYKFLKQLGGLEDSHYSYSRSYQFTLLNLGKFNEAFDYAKKLENKKLDNFESNLIIGIFYLKKRQYEKANKYFKKITKLENKEPLKVLLSYSLKNWISFSQINLSEALTLIEDMPNGFESLKTIQKTFAHCYYSSKITEQKFDELINIKKTDLTRFNFFYANYLLKIGKKDKAISVIDKSLKSTPRNLLLNQLNIDLSKNNKAIRNNKFNCKKISNIIAEIFYITSSAFSSQSLYAFSNFYLNIAKFLNEDFVSYDTLYAENLYRMNKTQEARNAYNTIKKKGSIYDWYASKQITNILIKKKTKEKSY